MPIPTAADFLRRAELAEKNAARATNARMREAFLKLAAAWRRLIALGPPRAFGIARPPER